MKAKSRRRLLISSVAMLLVAMLALGTATFAWFTQNTTANANGVYAQVVKTSSLQISKLPSNTGWASSVAYGFGTSETAKKMYPASSTNGVNWVTAISDNAQTGAIKDGSAAYINSSTGTLTKDTTSGTNGESADAKYVFKSMLNIKNTGEAGAINSVKIQSNLSGMATASDYIRVALVETAADGSTDTNFATSIYSKAADDDTAMGDGTAASTTGTVTVAAFPAAGISVGNLNAGEAKYYNLYVWFEGTDTNCIDDNAGQSLSNLTFTVSGVPAN